MPLGRDQGWAIPFDAPYYPALPAWYRNVDFQQVFFRADPVAVAHFLPEPLEPSADGECVATGIRIPFSSAYGPINEAEVDVKATFRGEPGWFCVRVWHDGPHGIAAGREIYGTPKVFSQVDIRMLEGTMLTRASIGGVPVITINSTTDVAIELSELRSVTPSWLLKIIPRADRPGPAIKQLIDSAGAAGNVQVHRAFRGRGTVQFEPSPFGDFTGITPLEYGPAYFFESSYNEGFGRIVLDYLAPDTPM